MEEFIVSGMTCAVCSLRVEKAVKSVDGVTSCQVNLLTGIVVVEGKFNNNSVIKAVKKAGYEIALKKEENINEKADKTTKNLAIRLISSSVFLLILLYFSMGVNMFNFPLPKFLVENMCYVGLIQMVLALVVIGINFKFYINGVKGVISLMPNMDTLVSLGSFSAFIYSLISLVNMFICHNLGEYLAVLRIYSNLYFEASAMILVLITLGKMLESISKGKTKNAINALIKMSPKTATKLVDGVETVIDANDLQVGDIFLVKPGESIPCDAIVIEGDSAVNQSVLTGESMPVNKTVGDTVFSATVNQNGALICRALKVREDTSFSQIIKMVLSASSSKAPIAKTADKISGIFVPSVMLIAVLTFFGYLIGGAGISIALSHGISVLVISCPCALGLATPVAIMVGTGLGAKHGVLFKTAESLEETGKANVIALDKTGTVTKGQPKVTDILPLGCDEDYLLSVAYSIESLSEHPLAKAIVSIEKEKNIKKLPVDNFTALVGFGLSGKIDGKEILAGNQKLIEQKILLSEKEKNIILELSNNGKTPIIFALEDRILGIIATFDCLKENGENTVLELKNLGLLPVLLSGDNKRVVSAVANQLQVEKFYAEVLPSDKQRIITELKEQGKVIMVGDGINDAPSLAVSDVGISLSSGTDVAIDSADVVLTSTKLNALVKAVKISKRTLKVIKQNLFWAFCYNIVGIPLAIGAFQFIGLSITPMFSAGAMSFSSVIVVLNALRLNFINVDKKIKGKNKGEKSFMNKEIKIEGIMCAHCESRVKTALESLKQVECATVSHVTGIASVTLKKDVDDKKLIEVIEKQGYKVLEIK